MSESQPSPRPMPLQARELALLTVAMVSLSLVSFGLGYLTGRDQVAYVHEAADRRGIDAELADPELVDLLAQIEVADAADKGVGELTYPDELRGRPQERLPSGGYAIDLGVASEARIDDLRTVLKNRGVLQTEVVERDDQTRLLVGAYADADVAASWLPMVEAVSSDLGLSKPKVVTLPGTTDEAP
ncbi:MAG: SPOR domain-containing protein [Myxococcota bacterium]